MQATATNMREAVRSLLTGAARRLLAVRALEAAAVGAVAGGLCAAAEQVAWIVAPRSPLAAAAICLAVMLVGWVTPSRRRFRRAMGLADNEARRVGAVCATAGLLGVVWVLAGWHAAVPKWLLPLVLMPSGALAAAVAAVLRGVTPLQAAILHDVRSGLHERLSTAAELAAAQGDDALACCVYEQALSAARHAQAQRQVPWRRTRATAGAVALSAALCGALAFVPTWDVLDVRASFERIGSRAEHLTPLRRDQVVRTLRRLAEQVRSNPRLLAALKAAAAAPGKELPARLRELEGALAGADDAEAAAIAKALLTAMGLGAEPDGPGGAGPGDGGRRLAARDANRPPPPDANAIVGRGGEKPLLARAYVWNPDYANVADANAPAPTPAAVSPAAFVPADEAWAAARGRASDALAAGRVPPEYRDLVRRFFELE